MKATIRTSLIGCSLLLFAGKAMAQQELNLFFSKTIPQASSTNPAAFKSRQTMVAFPSVAFNYGNNAFTFNELFRKEGGETYLNIGNILGQFKDDNILQTQLAVDLFSVQFRIKNLHLMLGMSEKMSARLSYSDELIQLAWNGNARYVGEQIEIGPAFDLTLYKEISLGWVYTYKQFTFGNRLRFLSGIANVTTAKHDAFVYTDDQFYQTSVTTHYEINTAGIDDFSGKSLGPFRRTGNPGFATDLGIIWKPSGKWNIAASALDIGSIKWKKDVERYHSQGNFSFEGLHLNNYFEVDTFNFDQYLDSLENEFDPDTSYKPYTKKLTPRFNLGVSRNLGEKHEIGIIAYGEFFNGFLPAVGLYYGFRPAQKTEFGFSYAIKNKLFNRFGISVSQQIKFVQLYFVSDDIINLFIPLDARSLNFRFGMNFFFGKTDEKPKSKEEENPE